MIKAKDVAIYIAHNGRNRILFVVSNMREYKIIWYCRHETRVICDEPFYIPCRWVVVEWVRITRDIPASITLEFKKNSPAADMTLVIDNDSGRSCSYEVKDPYEIICRPDWWEGMAQTMFFESLPTTGNVESRIVAESFMELLRNPKMPRWRDPSRLPF